MAVLFWRARDLRCMERGGNGMPRNGARARFAAVRAVPAYGPLATCRSRKPRGKQGAGRHRGGHDHGGSRLPLDRSASLPRTARWLPWAAATTLASGYPRDPLPQRARRDPPGAGRLSSGLGSRRPARARQADRPRRAAVGPGRGARVASAVRQCRVGRGQTAGAEVRGQGSDLEPRPPPPISNRPLSSFGPPRPTLRPDSARSLAWKRSRCKLPASTYFI